MLSRKLKVILGLSLSIFLLNYKLLLYSPTEKIVLYGATTYYYEKFFSEDIISQTCSKDVAEYCQFTTKPNRSKEASAWIYHNRDFKKFTWLMQNRTNRAVHVMLSNESPAYIYEKILFPPNTINYTMTYKSDSDIVVPYGIFIKNDSLKDIDFVWNMKSPNSTASWAASHCETENKREKIILKARKSGLKLDIYGKCFKGIKFVKCPRLGKDWELCTAALLQKYYFYIAFENSNCVDYVTEKYYNSLQFYYAIPIVIKRDIYTNMGFPPKSFIALDDFDSIQAMVKYLNKLKTNKTEYLSYHEWRKEYQVQVTPVQNGFCTLCQMLKEPYLKRKSYPDLKNWYSIKNNCFNNYADKYWK